MTVVHPVAQGYGARVSNDYVRLAPNAEELLRIYTRDSLAQRSQDETSTVENVLEIGDVFARTNWSGGEGYDWHPPENPLDASSSRNPYTSFWDSKNVVPSVDEPGQPSALTLAHRFNEWAESIDEAWSNVGDMQASNNFLYLAVGSTIYRYTSWDDVSPETSYTNPDANIICLAVAPNDAVMAVDVNGDIWYKSSSGSTFSEIYDSTTDGDDAAAVWYVKARWIVFTWNNGIGQLAELPTTGGAIASHVFDTMDAQVYSVVASGPAIVAAVFDGTVRTYTSDNADASSGQTLVPKGRSNLPNGETPLLVGSNADVLGILTISDQQGATVKTLRFYQAQVLDARFDYAVGQIQLRRTWYSVYAEPNVANRMLPTRTELWWLVNEDLDPSEDNDYQTTLWRLDVTTGGLFRHVVVADEPATLHIGNWDGRMALLVDDAVYHESDSYVESGYIITPNITFGLNTDIAWIAHVLETEFGAISNLNSVVELWYTTSSEAILDWQDDRWILARRMYSSQADIRYGEQMLVGVKSRSIALQIRLYPGNFQTSTPKVTRTAIRGIPTHRDFIVELPVNVSDVIPVPHRHPLRIPGRGDREHVRIMQLIGQHVELELYRPTLLLRGVVHQIAEPVSIVTDRGSATKVAMVVFLGSVIGTGSSVLTPVGAEGLGIAPLGITTLGIGEL